MIIKHTSRKPVRCTENELKLNLKNYWSNYNFYIKYIIVLDIYYDCIYIYKIITYNLQN